LRAGSASSHFAAEKESDASSLSNEAAMKKKLDSRIRALVENCVKLRQR
jgi:hypothetical protein